MNKTLEPDGGSGSGTFGHKAAHDGSNAGDRPQLTERKGITILPKGYEATP